MNIKLSVTLNGCNGNVDIKTLEKELRSALVGVEDSVWQESGMTDYPDTIRFKVISVEEPKEDD